MRKTTNPIRAQRGPWDSLAILAWISDNPGKVFDYWADRDLTGSLEHDVFLAPGWAFENGGHRLEGGAAPALLAALEHVRPCTCFMCPLPPPGPAVPCPPGWNPWPLVFGQEATQ